jgi:hypothetical protein
MRQLSLSAVVVALLGLLLVPALRPAFAEDDAAKDAYYKKMTAAASAKWEELAKDFKVEEGFDANDPAAFKGKLIQVETDNLMGYRFKPGDFAFATTLDGNPVAGKYDPTVAKAIKAVQAKLGRDLGDSDDDGKWTIIARVEGTKGKLTKKVKVEADVDGAKVSGEKAETVDAPIITIVAAHCGPLAVAKDKGMVKDDGTIGKP